LGWVWIVMIAGWVVVSGTNYMISVLHEVRLAHQVVQERIQDRLLFITDRLHTPSTVGSLKALANPWEHLDLAALGGTVTIQYAVFSGAAGHAKLSATGKFPCAALNITNAQAQGSVVLTRGMSQWLVVWEPIPNQPRFVAGAVNETRVSQQIWVSLLRQSAAVEFGLLIMALMAALAVAWATRRAFLPLMAIEGARDAATVAEHSPIKEIRQLALQWGQVLEQRRAEQERTAWLAAHDPLTGVLNRRGLLEHFHRVEATDTDRRWVVVVSDIDHFKQINDTYGHTVGDQLLDAMSQRLTAASAPGTVVARLGGDEFAFLYPGPGNDITTYLSRLLQQLTEPVTLNQSVIHPTLSAGAAVWPDHGNTLPEVLYKADLALYASKAHGRNTSTLYTPDLFEEAQRRVNLRHGILEAMERHSLVLFYQPIMDLKSGAVMGAEALLRWREGNTWIYPGQFLPYLDDESLLIQLGDYVLNNAIWQAGQWCNQGYHLRVGINITPAHFFRSGLIDQVRRLITQYQLPRGSIELEVTASLGLDDMVKANQIIRQLQKLGVMVAIDDFGTGYASLNYLMHLSADHIKLERSFVKDLSPGSEAWIVVGGVVALCRALSQNVVVQGIETPLTQRILHNMGVQEGQGDWFSPAIAAEDFTRWLAIQYHSQVNSLIGGVPARNLLVVLQFHVMQWAEQVLLFAKSPGSHDQQKRLLNYCHCPCGQWVQQLESIQLQDALSWAAFRRVHTRMHHHAVLLLEARHPTAAQYHAFERSVDTFLVQVQDLSREVLQTRPTELNSQTTIPNP
jgi:diguanylate cyclase (GGDEF)-like protein